MAAMISTRVKKLALREATTNFRHQRGVLLVGEAACVAIVAALHRYCCIFASIKSTRRLLPSPGKPIGFDFEVAQAFSQGIPVYAQHLCRAELVAIGFPQRMLEKRLLESGKRTMIERA